VAPGQGLVGLLPGFRRRFLHLRRPERVQEHLSCSRSPGAAGGRAGVACRPQSSSQVIPFTQRSSLLGGICWSAWASAPCCWCAAAAGARPRVAPRETLPFALLCPGGSSLHYLPAYTKKSTYSGCRAFSLFSLLSIRPGRFARHQCQWQATTERNSPQSISHLPRGSGTCGPGGTWPVAQPCHLEVA